jgi:lysozyme
VTDKKPASKTGPVAVGVFALAALFIADHEGYVPRSYADPAWGWKVPTACYGETGPHIVKGQTFTKAQCLAFLDAQVALKWREMDACIGPELTIPQTIAVTSWAYNVGTGAACRSTLVRQINAGQPARVWCRQLLRWDRANGKVMRGLTNRRKAEMELCLK